MQEEHTGQAASPQSVNDGQVAPDAPQSTGPPQPTLASKPPATPRHSFLKLSVSRPFIILIIIGVVAAAAGIGFLVGHHVGYSQGENAPYNYNPEDDCGKRVCPVVKPVIYLYPTQTEKVSVNLDYPAGFSLTRPAYDAQTGWQVLAKPDGSLTNLADGQKYSYLFWEGKPADINYDMNEGFVVSGSQTTSFLKQKLSYMGLTASETSDFIKYWQDTLEHNPYNLIHFAGSEYTDYARLGVSPKPDSELRIFMVYEPLTRPQPVTPQKLQPFDRHGFAVVEWGGTRVNPAAADDTH